MTKPELNLEFEQNRNNDYVAHAGRYTVTIRQEDYTENPWDAWDGEPPYMRAGYRIHDKPDTRGDFPDCCDIFKGITRAQLKRLCHELAVMYCAEIPGKTTPVDIYREAREELGYYAEFDMAVTAFELALNALYSSNPIPAYVAALETMGWTYLETASCGYCQGDYAELLFVASPQWAEKVGAPKETWAGQLESAAKLWGYWAWGDVYGFTIEDESGNQVDSLGGFYTDSPDTDSNMLDCIADGMPDDWHIDTDIGNAAIYTANY